MSVCEYLKEWLSVHAPRDSTISTELVQRWEAPEEGWVKANTDGALSKDSGYAGAGVILRGAHGDFIAASCHASPGIEDPEMAELIACQRAIQLAKETNVQNLHLETDSKTVASMILENKRNLSANGPLVERIKVELNSFAARRTTWVRRAANTAEPQASEGRCWRCSM